VGIVTSTTADYVALGEPSHLAWGPIIVRTKLTAICFAALVGLMAALAAPATALQIPQSGLVKIRPADFTPHLLDGEVDALAQVGNMIVVGGTFTQATAATGGPVLTRNYLMAFNKDTGEISTTFVPVLDDQVKALAAGPNGTVYVGGAFSNVNGTGAYKITQLNVSDGSRVTAFKPKITNAIVRDVRYQNGRLFMGGEFTTVQGLPRGALAELDPTTGTLLPSLDLPLTGAHWGGTTQVYHMDVSPDGTKLAIIGNFMQVAGQDRVEAAMIDLSTSPATVSNWQTDRFKPRCYSVFKFVVRDVEFSPDGSYFAIGTTGGYGSGSPTLCDSVTRWETSATGTALNPTWINYTGGDSTYTVTPTSSAIYVGGHQRWWNNPSRADAAGPGAVERTGIGALDPVNGLPLDWNPGRERGQGVFDMLATTEGLFIGSDTDRVNGEYHGRLAFFPLTGGAAVPQPKAPTLPVNVYSVGSLPTAGVGPILARVNAGGPTIAAIDTGPDWVSDNGTSSTLHNAGSVANSYSAISSLNASVPSTTPSGVFSTDRSDPSALPEMQWDFAAPVGAHLSVRLYFANQCQCTRSVGQRRFDVSIDGQNKLSSYDIVADTGNRVGTMKQFAVVSDGNVDIDFGHRTNDPLVNAIEIINNDAAPAPSADTAVRRTFTGSSATAPTTLANTGIEWSKARGAVLLDGNLYTAWSDGHLYKRSFDGTTFGAPTDVNLNLLTQFAAEMQKMTGMFYDNGRLYYTMTGSSNLSMRYFTTVSDMVGAGLKDLQPFVASTNTGGVDWSTVKGMFLAGNQLYWVNASTGTLNKITWTNGAPVAGTAAVVSGPGIDGVDWRSRALFAQQATPNQAPTARIGSSCTDLDCTFTGSTSSDTDGSIASVLWDFGDGTSSTETDPPLHHYGTAGTYTVTLTVTDNEGATGSASRSVTVDDVTSSISFVAAKGDDTNTNVVNHTVTVPATVQAGDALVLSFSDNAPNVAITAPAGWTQEASSSTSGMTARVWSKVATAADAGSSVRVSLASAARGNLVVSAYRGTSVSDPVGDIAMANETVNRATHTTPAAAVTVPGSWVLSYWTDKTAATTSWTAPAGQQVRHQYAGADAGHVSDLVTDGGAKVQVGPVGGLTATANSSSVQAIMATVVLVPAG
jgi:PKD repeat protein